MCGRVFEIYVAEELSDRYIDSESSVPFEVSPTYNLCPTDNSPVLRIADGKRQFEQMRWQLVPKTEPMFSTKLSTINAKSESVFDSRLYGDLVIRQRCIVPISGFFEWKRGGAAKRPFKIYLRDEAIMSVAGIWDAWRPGTKDERHSFSILTTSANEFMSSIHDRMPVILERSDEEVWLDPRFSDRASLQRVLKPCPSELLAGTEVSTLVNSTKNNSPDLLRPVEAVERTRHKTPTLFEL